MSDWELDLIDTSEMDKTIIPNREMDIQELKREKAKAKSAFTKLKHKLLDLLDNEPTLQDIKGLKSKFVCAEENAMDIMNKLFEEYKYRNDTEKMNNVTKEMEQLELQFSETEDECRDFINEIKSSSSGASNASNVSRRSHKMESTQLEGENIQFNQSSANRNSSSENVNQPTIGNDMWKQLKRVSIPIFTGEKRNYQSWKAAFIACIDKAPATKEYKLLQLRQYLSGEALQVINNLGHSGVAYDAAKDRLDRKYGGQRRQIAMYLEELECFRQIRDGCAKDIDKFADLLDIAVINLKEAGRTDELKNGSLYNKLQRKMTASMLSRYHRWIFENEETESVESLRVWILQEAEFQTIASETIYGVSSQVGNINIRQNFKRNGRDNHRTFFGESGKVARASQLNCKYCNKHHGIWACDEFRKLTVNKRWDSAKRLHLCYRCLGHNHVGKQCTRSRSCNVNGCKSVHHRLLHLEKINDKQTSTKPQFDTKTDRFDSNKSEKVANELPANVTDEETTMIAKETKKAAYVTLRTVPVIVKNGNRTLKVNALLDDASTKTYINSDVAAELGLQGHVQTVTVNVLNDEVETFETMPVQFELQNLDGNLSKEVVALTTNNVTGNMLPIDWRKHSEKWEHLKDIEFPSLGSKPKVDMLIGLDYSDLHYSYKDIRGNSGEPIARLTPLGWTCIGNPENGQTKTHFNHTYFVGNNASSGVDAILTNFWEIESVKPLEKDENLSDDNRKALNLVRNSVCFKDGQYEIGIPWKENVQPMPENYTQALHRLENTEKKLMKNEDIAKVYTETIDTYVKKGYVRKVVNDSDNVHDKWYLPHFPVVRPDRETTKTRIVFDASAKCNGKSLNDVIHQGPKLQRDLSDILLRFRRYPVALVCDIAEMYLRIKLAPQDRPFHRFLWRSMNIDEKPEIYEFNSVVFGVNASPFQAQFVTQNHAEINKQAFPLAAETVLKSTYMDDSMDSVINDETGIELYNQLSQLWSSAGMYPRKWLSNSKSVLECIPENDRAKEVNLDDGNLPCVKTLGIMWKATNDIFTFNANPPSDDFVYTKRNFLRKIAMLFDPLGFIAPFTIRAKMLLQEMWLSGYDWDENLDNDLVQKAKLWFSELNDLKCIEIQRCLQVTDQNEEIESSSIHTFVDSSQEAYGAVSYIRHVYKSGLISMRLVAAKSKVAPLTAVSIPRLELMAAILGLKLAISVSKPLGISEEKLVFWSDSMNVLWWIRGRSRDFKPFVANRIGEIHRATSPTQWRYIATNINPADLVSRGRTVRQLEHDNLWWEGPDFLSRNEQFWPQKDIVKGQSCNVEVRRNAMKSTVYSDNVTLKTIHVQDSDWRLNPERFSNWIKLVRVRAWVNRFVENCRLTVTLRKTGTLSKDEIDESEIQIIRDAQQSDFSDEYRGLLKNIPIAQNSKLLTLNPKIDDNGLLRCDGRLKYAEFLPYDTRNPIILPRKNYVTRLIVKYFHEKGKHICGTNHTLSLLSAKYWIISGREEIRQFESECYGCRRRKAKSGQQLMAPLPDIRFKMPLQAFSRTAVDFAGPFITIQGRGKRREKRYLCLFTCLASRAVHLELAYGLDTDSFLNAFYRMVNRRGLPKEVLSDNGTNFVSANRELKELVKQLDKDKINDSVCNRGIIWHFNPPAAPHFGGVHETMIKSAKKAIHAILGNADITDEELLTAFTGAESLINSRPLTYQSANPQDDTPLTPNHFLHGQIGGQFAPESVDETDFNPRKRWRRIQELIRHFWNRWTREWLPELNRRLKWTKLTKDLKVNDIVLVMNQNVSRGHWPLGRIIEVFPGKDGLVRVAKVRLGQNYLIRPLSKLCPLELDATD